MCISVVGIKRNEVLSVVESIRKKTKMFFDRNKNKNQIKCLKQF